MQKYISVNERTNETGMEVHMTNKGNEVCGTFKVVLDPETGEIADIKDVFLSKDAFKDVSGEIEQMDTSGNTYTIRDIANKLNAVIDEFNELVSKLKRSGDEPTPEQEGSGEEG